MRVIARRWVVKKIIKMEHYNESWNAFIVDTRDNEKKKFNHRNHKLCLTVAFIFTLENLYYFDKSSLIFGDRLAFRISRRIKTFGDKKGKILYKRLLQTLALDNEYS